MLRFLNFTFIDFLDILMVAVIIFIAFRWIKGSTAVNIFIAIILLLLMQIVSSAIGMKMMSSILGTVIDVGAVALIVIFQPEIRRFLNSLGRRAGDTLEKRPALQKFFFKNAPEAVDSRAIDEIAQACKEMADQKTGALIVIRGNDSLDEIIATGDTVDSRIGCRILLNIFFKNSPLHDGAVVIGGNRIVAARCTLPISERTDLPPKFGMRHKAAIGISEQCDASVLVVSEQRGQVSFVRRGKIEVIDSLNRLKLLLGQKND